MSIHSFFNRQFPLRSRTRGVAFFCFILLMYGCGGEESVDKPIVEAVGDEKPINDVPIAIPYYPMTVGNRWVYRNPDGAEWAREVIETKNVDAGSYHDGVVSYCLFSYNPSIEDKHSDFFKTPTYLVTDTHLGLLVTDNHINDAIWQTIQESRGENSSGRKQIYTNGEWSTHKQDGVLVYLHNSTPKVASRSDLVLLSFPFDPIYKGRALHMILRGIDKTHPPSYVHSYEAKVKISIGSSYEGSVATPMGLFEDCVKIQYDGDLSSVETQEFEIGKWNWITPKNLLRVLVKHLEDELRNELTILLRELMPRLHLQTMWLAPGVGPVKIVTPDGIAELIDYEVKAVASG